MTAKEFALEQIAPYYKDPSLCGIDKNGNCKYLTDEGKMCVAGKNMLNPMTGLQPDIQGLISEYSQETLFKPDAVGILSVKQWVALQNLHDSIAAHIDVTGSIEDLGLFSIYELEEAANKL